MCVCVCFCLFCSHWYHNDIKHYFCIIIWNEWSLAGLICIAQIAGVMIFKGPEEKQLLEWHTVLSNKNYNTLGLMRMLDIFLLSS
jgi:hypothetical protein